MPRTNNRRFMISGEEEIPYKCAGTKRSQIGNNDLCYNKKEENFHLYQKGQHGNPVLFNEKGGQKKPGISLYQHWNLGLALIHNYCRVHTRRAECRRRQRIEEFKRFKRLELKPQVFKKMCLVWVTLDMDLFPSRFSYQIPQYHLRKLSLFRKGHGAFQVNWNQIYFYVFPTFAVIERQ